MVAVNRTAYSGPASGGAPALRFLAFCIGGWIALRALMLWSAATPAPPIPVAPPWFPTVLSGAPDQGAIAAASAPVVQRIAHGALPRRPRHAATPAVPDLGADLPQLSLALMARLFPAAPPRAAAAEPRTWNLATAPARAAPGRGGAFWMQRQLSGLSASAWVYLRDGDGRSLAGDGQLGGSQAGFRVAHALAGDGALRVYGRATAALRRPEQSELALGLAFAPAPGLPVDVAVERRMAIGHEGRSAFAAMVVGGVSALPRNSGGGSDPRQRGRDGGRRHTARCRTRRCRATADAPLARCRPGQQHRARLATARRWRCPPRKRPRADAGERLLTAAWRAAARPISCAGTGCPGDGFRLQHRRRAGFAFCALIPLVRWFHLR
jgi:hypothetical protein